MSEVLHNRDYVLILDKSGSMQTRDMPGGKSRWQGCQEGALALATKIEEFDKDGIDVYAFASQFKYYEGVTAAKVGDVFKENDPNGSTALDLVLQDACDKHFARKSSGKMKANGTTILVVTDGEPNDRKAAASVIVEASKKIDKDEELAIQFIQIGKDQGATAYLKTLDDDLTSQGAKYDIVDAKTADEIENMTFVEALTQAITD